MSNKIFNPVTGRFIDYLGPTHRRMIREGKMSGEGLQPTSHSVERAEVGRTPIRPAQAKIKAPQPAQKKKRIYYEESVSSEDDQTETVQIKSTAKRPVAKRTPEEQKAINDRMAYLRSLRKKA